MVDDDHADQTSQPGAKTKIPNKKDLSGPRFADRQSQSRSLSSVSPCLRPRGLMFTQISAQGPPLMFPNFLEKVNKCFIFYAFLSHFRSLAPFSGVASTSRAALRVVRSHPSNFHLSPPPRPWTPSTRRQLSKAPRRSRAGGSMPFVRLSSTILRYRS